MCCGRGVCILEDPGGLMLHFWLKCRFLKLMVSWGTVDMWGMIFKSVVGKEPSISSDWEMFIPVTQGNCHRMDRID